MVHDFPVMEVLFDEEGDWQVLCGETQDPKDGVLVCLGCAYEKNPVIGQFANLEPGYEAYRETVDSDWVIDKIVWSDPE